MKENQNDFLCNPSSVEIDSASLRGKKEMDAFQKENQADSLWDQKKSNGVPLALESHDRDAFGNTPELECAVIAEDFSTYQDGNSDDPSHGTQLSKMKLTNTSENEARNENESRDSVAPCITTPSSGTELFEDTDLYTDKNVLECELPELMVCHRDNTYVVKDICIDEGVPSEDKFLVENGKDKCLFTPLPSNNNMSGGLMNEGMDIKLRSHDELNYSSENDHEKEAHEFGTEEKVDFHSLISDRFRSPLHSDLDKSICKVEGSPDTAGRNYEPCGAMDNVANYISEGNNVPEGMPPSLVFSKQKSLKLFLESPDSDGNEAELECAQVAKYEGYPLKKSSSPANNLIYDSKVENSNFILDFNSAQPPANSSRSDSPDNVKISKQAPKTDGEMRHEEGTSWDGGAGDVQRDHGESSFCMAGPVSGLITYSGPIACAGSISLRSDSSTTSTRSFAFPILQSEWNSSPVRMAKADGRDFRKHRGWRQGLLCCRF